MKHPSTRPALSTRASRMPRSSRLALAASLAILALASLLAAACASSPAPTTQDKAASTAQAPAPRSIPADAKLVALTFDDGPDVDLTPRVLDRLQKYQVPATFFLVGLRIDEDTKPVLDRAKALGCEFGNHSWSYSGMDKMDAQAIRESVDKTSAAIQEFTGTTPRFFRAPNLATSPTLHKTVGLPFMSGVVGMDWGGCNTNAEQRAANVLKGVRDGSIILLHDVQSEPHPTPEALDILIPELQAKGYFFVTLSELFAAKGVTPDPYEETQWSTVF